MKEKRAGNNPARFEKFPHPPARGSLPLPLAGEGAERSEAGEGRRLADMLGEEFLRAAGRDLRCFGVERAALVQWKPWPAPI